MIKSRIRTASAGAGLLLTMIVASPVWADDVELLLSTPADNSAKPNLMFILDSSGSMTGKVASKVPYDSEYEYEEVCDDKLYWTTGPDVPDCLADNGYELKDDKFYCNQGMIQLEASGKYTGTLAMYRKDDNGNEQWTTLDPEEDGKPIECADDSGLHGEDEDDDEVYAQIGIKQDEWTTDPLREVDWGVQPTHSIVTVYHWNYLNYLRDESAQEQRKTDIVQAVMKNVLGDLNNVNVGMMRFNYDDGGPVTFALKDLDQNRDEANDVVDDLPASGYTPLGEVMYEAARYFRGMNADYGTLGSTDADALDTEDPLNYKQPIEYACSKNFVVLLTDGLPRRDYETHAKLPLLPDFTEATGQTACTPDTALEKVDEYDGCLDDVARYMANADLNSAQAGKQNAVTFTIGFDVEAAGDLLQATATAGQGKYFVANDVSTLTEVLTEITSEIFNRDISFTAPAVSVNAFNRTQNLNDLYISVFRAADEVQWPGNLKKYRLKGSGIVDANKKDAIDSTTGYFADSAKNYWNKETEPDGPDVFVGGTANILPAPADRKLYTNNKGVDPDVVGSDNLTDATNALKSSNSLFTAADFGLVGSAGEPTVAQIIDWARGQDVKDDNGDGDTTDKRNSMGDTLHSQPASVVYGKSDGTFDVVVFAGTNDGYLHAVDADSGEEKWAFVPRELLDNFADLYFNENVTYKNYGLDGDIVPVVYDEDNDGIIESSTDFVYLLFGLRRGGNNYYMVEVTDPDTPKLRWVKTVDEVGQSWSPPAVAKVDVKSDKQTSAQEAVVIFGGGYDTVHDAPAHPDDEDGVGNRVIMLDLETGEKLWDAGDEDGAKLDIDEMTRSIPGRIRVVDLNGDGYADRMYAADLGGQIFRFDILNGKEPGKLVTGGVIARLGAEGLGSPTIADTRRFYTTPDVSIFTDKRQDRRFVAVSIGSGYRAHPLNTSNVDRFYSIRDPDVFNRLTKDDYDDYDVIEDADLTEVSGKSGTVISASGRGWKFTLPDDEKVLSDSVTFDNTVFFVTMAPRSNTTDPCQAGLSVNTLYRVNVVNGDPIYDQGGDVTLDDPDEKRVTALRQGGIAPKPTFFFPSPDDPDCTGDACRPPPVGCVGTECFDPGFVNLPVRTLWTQDGIQ